MPEANEALIMDTIRTFRDAINVFSARPADLPPRSNRSNLRNPDTFDGSDPAKLSSFLTQCYLHFAERPQDFPDDDDRILYIISYLRGSAQQWFSPNLYDPTIIPVWDGNFAVFIQELTLNFGPHDPVGDAEDKIRVCRMKSGDRITTYIIEFDFLSVLTRWSDNALRYQFYEGLPRRIKDDMVHHNYANTLDGVKLVARIIDGRYWKREAEKLRERERDKPSGSGGGNATGGQSGNPKPSNRNSGKGSKSSNAPAPSSTAATAGNSGNNAGRSGNQGKGKAKSSDATPAARAYADKLDASGKIKQDERERRRKNNLCMYCGGKGHTADNCNKRPGQASAKAAQASTSGTTTQAPAAPAMPAAAAAESKN